MEDFVLEKVLKNDDRQKIEVIYNPKTNQRFIKRSVNDDIRYIYKMLQKSITIIFRRYMMWN